jgi:glycosyltransferase involved in cell wall biosynthesis
MCTRIHALVSAIIPARNEAASIARVVESLAAQPEVGEVIVVDDQSTDGTGAILAQLALRLPKLKVLHAGDLPPGWVGKNHAVDMGAAAAQFPWLLFTDADTYHLPGATRRALVDAVEHDAVLVSYSPEQEMATWWERALIPYVYCRLAAKFSYARVNSSEYQDAAANGQFILVLRDAYAKAGGHAAIAGEVLEDVKLARRMKGMGYRIYFTAPVGIVRTRMYRSFRAMWEGWTKNLYALMGGSSKGVIRELLHALSLPVLVGLLFLFNRKQVIQDPGSSMTVLAMALIAWHGFYGIELYRSLYPVSYIKYLLPGVCLYCGILVSSWWKSTHGTIEWKGRRYTPKAGQA